MELYYFHIFLLASGHHEKTTHKLREQRNEQVWGSLMRRILTWLGLTHLWLSLAPSSIALWVCVLNRSVMSDSATPWTITPQAYRSMEFPRQEDWSGLPFPIPGDLPDPGIEPISPVLVGVFFTTEPWGKPWESSKQSSNFRCHSVVRWNSSLFSLTGLDALDLEVSVAKHHCGHCLGLWSDHPEAQLAWSGWGTPSAQTV